MIWYLTPDQMFIRNRDFKKPNKKQVINNMTYELARARKENIENKNEVSKH
jgi:hypothetical protein